MPAFQSHPPLSQVILNCEGNVIDVGDGLGDRHRFTVRLYDSDSAIRVSLHRLDLVPCGDKAAMSDAVVVDRDSITLLHYPADHGEKVDDQESGRENEVDNLLTDIKDNQHCHEEKERQNRDDRSSLKEGSGGTMDADNSAQI